MEIPGYKIAGEIGRGGMATVYLAVHELLRRQVALKVMDPALMADKSFTERFLKEGQIIAQLNHPQIITVYDIGCHNYYYYLCMEFLPGGSLDQRIRAGLPLAQTLEIIKKISSALGYAHSQGVVHRDIKPQNILFRKDDTPVLTDFGIARRVDSNTHLTIPGFSVGSPRFMSPEQALAQKVDARSDLYSLGIIFYQMLTSKLPYEADDLVSIVLLHCTSPIPTLPPELHQFQPILEKLLAKRPKDRFQTAEEFGQTLTQISDSTAPVATASIEDVTVLQLGGQDVRFATPPRSVSTPTSTPTIGHVASLKKGLALGGVLLLLIAGAYLALKGQKAPIVLYYKELATQYLSKGELEQSLNSIEMGLQAVPNDASLVAMRDKILRLQEAARLFDQAQQHQREGVLEESLVFIDKGLQLAPDHVALNALRKQVQQELTQRQIAAQLLAQAEQRQQAGALEDSLLIIDKGLQAAPHHPGLIVLRSKVLAQQQKEQQQQIEAQQRRQESQRLLAQAEQQLQQGALQDSLTLLDQGLRITPDDPSLKRLQIEVWQQLAQRQEAEQLLAQSRQRQQAGALDESLTLIDKGLQLAPNYPPLLELRDQVQARQREQQEEAEAQRRQQVASQLLVQAEQRWRQGALEDSLVLLDKGLQLAPEHPRLEALRERVKKSLDQRQQAEHLLAQAKQQQHAGRLQDSLARINEALKLTPTSASLLTLRNQVQAQQWREQQEAQEAQRRQQAVARLLQKCVAALQAGRLLTKQVNNAVDCYREVLVEEADNTQAMEGLRQVAEKYVGEIENANVAGDYVKADNYLQALKQLNPQHPKVEILQRQQATLRQQTADRLLEQAQALYRRGKLQQSLAPIDKGLQLVPDHAGLQNLGQKVKAELMQQDQIERQRQANREERRRQEELQRQHRPTRVISGGRGDPQKPASKQRIRQKNSRCGDILSRQGLGESLSSDDLAKLMECK